MNWKRIVVLFLGFVAFAVWGLAWFSGLKYGAKPIMLLVGWMLIIIPTAGLYRILDK